MSGAYRIADEPIAGPLAKVVVNPFFPLLGGMLGGFGVGLVWFLVNGAGMGSATRRKEIAVAIGALLLVFVYSLGLFTKTADQLSPMGIKLAVLGLQLIKLVVLYALQAMQSRSFGLHQHFGGHVANGIPVLLIAMLARPVILQPFPSLLKLVLQ